MKIVIVLLLLGVTLAQSLECLKQPPSSKITEIGGSVAVNLDTSASTTSTTCEAGDVCASITASGSYQTSGASTSWEYESEQKGCLPDVCAANAGRCVKATYDFGTTQAQVCGVTVDPTEYSSSVFVSCCDGNSCNTGSVDETQCDLDSDFSNYMESLQSCWTAVYAAYSNAICNDPNLATYVTNCRSSTGTVSSSLRSSTECEYRLTCNDAMKAEMQTFGQCACRVTNGVYNAEFMTALMKSNWETYCPNLEFDCTGATIVKEQAWYTVYKILINIPTDGLSAADIIDIQNLIAAVLNVAPKALTITVTVKTRRRLLADQSIVTVTFQSDDEGEAQYAESKLNEQVATDIGTLIGAETTMIDVTTEESSNSIETSSSSTTEGTYDSPTTEGTDNSSASGHIVYFMALFTVIIAGFN